MKFSIHLFIYLFIHLFIHSFNLVFSVRQTFYYHQRYLHVHSSPTSLLSRNLEVFIRFLVHFGFAVLFVWFWVPAFCIDAITLSLSCGSRTQSCSCSDSAVGLPRACTYVCMHLVQYMVGTVLRVPNSDRWRSIDVRLTDWVTVMGAANILHCSAARPSKPRRRMYMGPTCTCTTNDKAMVHRIVRPDTSCTRDFSSLGVVWKRTRPIPRSRGVSVHDTAVINATCCSRLAATGPIIGKRDVIHKTGSTVPVNLFY